MYISRPPTPKEITFGKIDHKISSLLPGIDQTYQVCSNDDQRGSIKIVTFMTPGAEGSVLGFGHISHIVKMHFFFKNLLLYSLA